MLVLEARRLTGPNLLLDSAGAAVEVAFEPAELVAAAGPRRIDSLARVRLRLQRVCSALHWPVDLIVRWHGNGATLAFAAELDRLNTATDLLEWAIRPTTLGSLPRAVAKLSQRLAKEANPDLLRLQAWAQDHGIRMLWDD